MATTTTASQPLRKSVTLGTNDTTLAGLAAAAAVAGVPDKATVTTGGYYRPDALSEEAWNYSVTFIWDE